MRSSACVVMETKAVAGLLRNKMAGVVSLYPTSYSSSSPSFSSPFPLPFLFAISEPEQIGCDTAPPPPHFHYHHLHPWPVLPSHFAPYSVLPTVHSHSTYVSQHESATSRSCHSGRNKGDALAFSFLFSVRPLNQLVESVEEGGSHRQLRHKKVEEWGFNGPHIPQEAELARLRGGIQRFGSCAIPRTLLRAEYFYFFPVCECVRVSSC